MVDTPEILLEQYARHVRNLRDADESGLDEDLVLATRTAIADLEWTPEQHAEIDRLDAELVSHWRIFEGTLPHHQKHPREQWWWFLNEGPQVRAKHAAITA